MHFFYFAKAMLAISEQIDNTKLYLKKFTFKIAKILIL